MLKTESPAGADCRRRETNPADRRHRLNMIESATVGKQKPRGCRCGSR